MRGINQKCLANFVQNNFEVSPVIKINRSGNCTLCLKNSNIYASIIQIIIIIIVIIIIIIIIIITDK